MEEPPLTKGRFGISVKNDVGVPINRVSTEPLGALKLKEKQKFNAKKALEFVANEIGSISIYYWN